MNVSKINSLVELYFKKKSKLEKKKPFLKWLKPNNNIEYTWEEVTEKIYKLTNQIKIMINEGDRVLLLSENRPEWFIADIAIMNAGGITVPIFTTYAENDYKYILKDCSPSLIIVSNDNQFKKIEKFIENKKIISFETIQNESIPLSVIFKKEGKGFIDWARNSVWSKDTGGPRDKNGAPIRAMEGRWKELWESTGSKKRRKSKRKSKRKSRKL